MPHLLKYSYYSATDPHRLPKMSFRKVALFALLSVFALASADSVVVATKDNFKDVIGKDGLTLVKFFAPWCGHCKNMKKDFEKAATELKDKAVLVDVDVTEQKELGEEYGIKGFPTLKLFSKGEFIADYKGGRKADDFVKYIERALLPSIVDAADKDALDAVLKEHSGKNIFISVAADKLAGAFKKASFSIRDMMPDGITFVSVPDVKAVESAAVEATVAADNILLVREDGTTDVYTGDAEDLEAWIKVGSLPLLGELSRESASMYTELPKPLFMLFKDPKSTGTDITDAVKEVAASVRSSGKLAFVWINAVELKSFMDHIGITEAPGIAIYKFDSDTKFVYDGVQPPTAESMKEWVDKFIDGKVTATIKSAPVPEKNDEPVKVVVGDTWKQIVEDESKDVLIEQYAPWCGHCKKLEPVLTEVSKAVAGVDTLVIAKMDATANDAPQEYKPRGFPTMHFFPAGGKEPIPYESGRSKEDFIKFFKKHATHQEGLDAIEVADADEKDEKKADEEKDEL